MWRVASGTARVGLVIRDCVSTLLRSLGDSAGVNRAYALQRSTIKFSDHASNITWRSSTPSSQGETFFRSPRHTARRREIYLPPTLSFSGKKGNSAGGAERQSGTEPAWQRKQH